MPMMLEAYAGILVEETGEAPLSAEELLMMWSEEESRLKALELISTKEIVLGVLPLISKSGEISQAGTRP